MAASCILASLCTSITFVALNAFALCPPPLPWSSKCDVGVDRANARREQLVRRAVKRLLQVQQADGRACGGKEAAALLAVYEGVRISGCIDDYADCYMESEQATSDKLKVCSVGFANAQKLQTLGSPTSLPYLQQEACTHASESALMLLMRHGLEFLAQVSLVHSASLEDVPPKPVRPLEDLPPKPVCPLFYPAEFAPAGACNFSSLLKHTPMVSPPPWRDITEKFSPFHISTADVLLRLKQVNIPLSNFVINLGAADGDCLAGPMYDPANCLLLANYSGIAFDADEERFLSMARRYADRPDVHVRLGEASPAFAVSATLAISAPSSPDLLKIDMDNGDPEFIQAFLQHLEPKLIHAEIEAELPPGLLRPSRFRSKGEGDILPPMSPGVLGDFLKVVRPRYQLLQVEFMNALFLRTDLFSLIDRDLHLNGMTDEERWRLGYFCHPLRTTWPFSPGRALRLYPRPVPADPSQQGDPSLPLEAKRELSSSFSHKFEVLVDPAYVRIMEN